MKSQSRSQSQNASRKGQITFSSQTFDYLKAAQKNKKNKAWFEKHRSEYDKSVKAPFEELIDRLQKEFSKDLPRIDFNPRKIARPVRRNPDEDGGIIRTEASAFFSERPTSQFEWNPGIYLSISSKPAESVFGLGLYMVSSRQMSLLRNGIVQDFDLIDEVLSEKKFKKTWGELRGDVYKRFPKGFDENSEPAKYLRHKQFFLAQDLTQKTICQKNFFDKVVSDVEVSLPFLKWVRKTVGVYNKRQDHL